MLLPELSWPTEQPKAAALQFNSEIEVFPNPSFGGFKVTGLYEAAVLVLYDAQGRQVQQWEFPAHESQLEFVVENRGVYYLSIRSNADGKQTLKQIIRL